MAVEALKSKLAPPTKGTAEAAEAADATVSAAAEAAATAAEVLEPDPKEVLRQQAAELLKDELHELGKPYASFCSAFFCFAIYFVLAYKQPRFNMKQQQ